MMLWNRNKKEKATKANEKKRFNQGFYAGTAEISVIPVLNRLPMYPGQ